MAEAWLLPYVFGGMFFIFLILGFWKNWFFPGDKIICLHVEDDLKYMFHKQEGSKEVCYNRCTRCGAIIHD